MPRTKTAKTAFISQREQRLAGSDLGWPALRFVTASEGFEAERVAWHSHEGHELLMFLSGAAEYEFRVGRRLCITGEQFLIVPPSLRHRSVGDVRSPTVHSSITIDLSPEVRAMPPLLKRLVRALHHEVSQPQGSPTVPDVAAALRLQIARIVIEAAKAGDHRRSGDATGVVASAVAYLERNFTSPLQMDEVAEAVQCSRSKLYAAFKRDTGMSPNDWLLRLRVKNAEELLVDSRRAVKDIALAVGFSSHAYFCQVFRKYTGRAPASVRAT